MYCPAANTDQANGPGSDYTVVAGNRIGTDVTGTVSITNVAGVSIRISDYTRIGTNGDGVSDEFERNIISGNDGEAIAYPYACIAISFYRVSNSVIAGNYIGTDVTGLVALPNDSGINTSDSNQRNRIGTDANGIADAAERNVISGNTGWQVNIHSGWQDSIIAGNYIGVGADGTTPLGGIKASRFQMQVLSIQLKTISSAAQHQRQRM